MDVLTVSLCAQVHGFEAGSSSVSFSIWDWEHCHSEAIIQSFLSLDLYLFFAKLEI